LTGASFSAENRRAMTSRMLNVTVIRSASALPARSCGRAANPATISTPTKAIALATRTRRSTRSFIQTNAMPAEMKGTVA
jgi:hypothetical protein